jgi:hypothetical protein
VTSFTAQGLSEPRTSLKAPVDLLPSPAAWLAAAVQHGELFVQLDPGVRIALLARAAPAQMLVWEASGAGIDTRIEPFVDYAASAADIVLAADDEALSEVRSAVAGRLFEVLRARIRSGHIVCYMLKRRCVLEERGLDELLEALGFAFMGACR